MAKKKRAATKPPLGRFLDAEYIRLGINQAHVAKQLKQSTAAVSKWHTQGKISKENLAALAKLLGRSVDDLYAAMAGTLGIRSNVKAVARGEALSESEVAIKVSEIRFRGGPGHDLVYEIEEDSEPVTYQLAWLSKEGINPKNLVRFRHHGDSNEPFLFNGDWIAVDISDKTIRNGRLYAFWHHGEGRRVKRLFLRPNGDLIIRSYNPEYPEEVIPGDKLDETIIIIGRVRDKGGRGGL